MSELKASNREILRRCFSEALGTFGLVFAGTGAIVINDVSQGAVTHVGIALTFGLIVMAMIYALGDVSGAHLNPAVTLAFWGAGRFHRGQVVPYLTAQLLGAFAASGLLRFLFLEHGHLGATLPAGAWFQSFLLEVILTFLLMLVILQVSSESYEMGMMAGAAIGGVVALEALFAGPICGASMNPARSLAPAIVSGHISEVWIYVAAPVIGAFLAIPATAIIAPIASRNPAANVDID